MHQGSWLATHSCILACYAGHAWACSVDDCCVPCRNARVLRDFARNWLPLLFNAFIGTDAQQREQYAAAIAAYATIADPATLSHFFREVIKKLLKARHGFSLADLFG